MRNGLTLRFGNVGNGSGSPALNEREKRTGCGRPGWIGRADTRMADDSQFLRAQAKKCRWLAGRISSGDVVETLLQMARDYEERAARKEDGSEGDESPL